MIAVFYGIVSGKPEDDPTNSAADFQLSVQTPGGERRTIPVSVNLVVEKNGKETDDSGNPLTVDCLRETDRLHLVGQPVVRIVAVSDPVARAAWEGLHGKGSS